MCEPNCPHDERDLAARLRREDLAQRPAFSEALHARICAALDAPADDPRPLVGPARRTALRGPWLAAALTAACAALVAVVLWKGRPAPEDVALPAPPAPAAPDVARPPPPAELAPVALLPRDVSALPLLVDTAIVSQQWAWLDHDARLTGQMLAARLPFAPAAAPARQGM